MRNKNALDQLRSYRRKLKKLPPNSSRVRVLNRVNALIAYYKGQSPEVIAECYDVSSRSVKDWIKAFETQGIEELEEEPRSGRPQKLPPEKEAELMQIIHTQNQRIWVARHIYQLLLTSFEVVYAVKYLPQFLKKIGLSFHKAVHNLVRRDSQKRREWIEQTLPQIYQKKIQEGWRIFYQDEVGFATEGTLGYTWGIEGQKTEIKNYGRHGRVNVMGAFELGTGLFYGVLTSLKVNATRFRRFLCHLKHEMRTDKLLLICDNASFHKARWLTEWIQQQSAWLHLEFLPPYSPDFNPIERLWRWIKSEFIHNRCWKSLGELKTTVKGIFQQLPAHQEALKSLMHKENERFQTLSQYYGTAFFPLFDLTAESG